MKRIFLVATAIIALASSSQAQITTDPNGNVGVGITTPAAQLHVFGPGQSTANLSPAGSVGGTLFLQDSNGAPGNGGAVLFGSMWGPFAGIKGLVQDGRTYTIGDLAFSTRASISNSSFTERMRISYTGNVGVATPSPISLFQVDDGCTKTCIGDAGGTDLNYGTGYLGFNAARNSGSWIMHGDGLNNGGGMMYASIFGDLYFAPIASAGTQNRELSDATVKSRIALRIDPSGVTHAKKVIVELTGWPDYVFKLTYSLKPLSEVKSYIDVNHHLPEMPSEKEVAEKGVDLGEMNKLLTKKVEELTLYLIEKDKEIKEITADKKDQQEVNKSQQQQIDELKKQIAHLIKQ